MTVRLEEHIAALAAELAAIDALIARSSKVLAGDPRDSTPAPAPRTPLIYGEEFDEDARLKEWHALVEATRDLPPVFAAALAADAWVSLAPLEHQAWLGRMIIPDFLRARQKTRHHLLCLNVGLKTIPASAATALIATSACWDGFAPSAKRQSSASAITTAGALHAKTCCVVS